MTTPDRDHLIELVTDLAAYLVEGHPAAASIALATLEDTGAATIDYPTDEPGVGARLTLAGITVTTPTHGSRELIREWVSAANQMLVTT